MLRWLTQAVAAMSGGDRLSYLLIGLIADRIRGIKQRVARLAARIRDGRALPQRRSAPRRSPTASRPRRPDPLPRHFGWLLPLVPDAVAFRSQLEFLLRDPDMAALLATAPASLRRPIRSLCWMLRVTPPPILAPPRPTPPAAPPAAVPRASPPRPHPSPPASSAPSRVASPPTPRACGPPRPA